MFEKTNPVMWDSHNGFFVVLIFHLFWCTTTTVRLFTDVPSRSVLFMMYFVITWTPTHIHEVTWNPCTIQMPRTCTFGSQNDTIVSFSLKIWHFKKIASLCQMWIFSTEQYPKWSSTVKFYSFPLLVRINLIVFCLKIRYIFSVAVHSQ